VDATDVPAEVGQFNAVVGGQVEARDALVTGVGGWTDYTLGSVAVQRAVYSASLDGLAAVIELEVRVHRGAVAAVDDIIQAGAVDRLVDLDVIVVEAQAQARHEGRLPDGADGPGVGFFRTQVRVAAGLLIDLTRVGLINGADQGVRNAGEAAEIAESAGSIGFSAVDPVFLARINGAVAQAGDLRVEQLADVRRTRGALIHCTNAD